MSLTAPIRLRVLPRLKPINGVDGRVLNIVGGTNVEIDETDPSNPIVSVPDAIVAGDGRLLPAGGATGRILAKSSDSDFDAEWVASLTGGGDMIASAYDPQGKGTDAFDMDNMTETATAKVFTGLERLRVAVGAIGFATVAAASSPSAAVTTAPDYLQTSGYASAADNHGALYRKRSVIEADDDGDFTMTLADGVTTERYALAIQERVTPVMFAAALGGADDSTPFRNAARWAAKSKVKLLVDDDYTLDSVDLSAAPGILRMEINGTLTHVAGAAAGSAFDLTGLDAVVFTGSGTFDGNYANQTNRTTLIETGASGWIEIRGLKIQNIQEYGISLNSSSSGFAFIEGNVFENGRGHTGVSGENCIFIQNRGGRYTSIKGNKFSSDHVNGTAEARNPAGIINGSSNADCMVDIEGNFFSNLGFSSSGNHVAAVDNYQYSGFVRVAENRFYLSKLYSIRVSNVGQAVVDGNFIYQTDPILQNGITYSDASIISGGLVDRGYPNDSNDNNVVRVMNNVIICNFSVAPSLGAIRFSSSVTKSVGGDMTNISRHVICEANHIASIGTAHPTNSAIFFSTIRQMTVRAGSINWPGGIGITAQQTNVATTPLAAERECLLSVENASVKATIPVFARTGVTNLKVNIAGGSLQGTTNDFSVRNAAALTIIGAALSASNGDVSTLGSLIIDGCTGITGKPTGFASCTYWRVSGCPSIRDQSSAITASVILITTDAGAAFAFVPKSGNDVVILTAAITTDRAASLAASPIIGDRVRFVRSASATGAFNWNIGTGPLKALSTAGTFADFLYNGSAWVLIGSGSL